MRFWQLLLILVPSTPAFFIQEEVVYIQRSVEAISSDGANDMLDFGFTAFGRSVELQLERNAQLLSPYFVTLRDGTPVDISEPPMHCHYLQQSPDVVAAMSNCHGSPHFLHGFVILENDTLEIRPLLQEVQDDLQSIPHIVRRSPTHHPDVFSKSDELVQQDSILSDLYRPSRATGKTMTVELALFFDEAGYRLFSPYFDGNDAKLRDMLLAYVNGVQALYHHPSLGQAIDLVLVRLDLFTQQPSDLPHFGGERGKLLDSFCDYNSKHNPGDDSNPAHWDMGLYISGLDFFAYENGRKSGVTMGLATVGGVCHEKYACVIAELGTTNVFGKPYPSAGFTSVYILAHEIGHNLGMHHDSSQNSCPKDGYIMSPSRGTSGETVWSPCSAEIIRKLEWAKCLTDTPGSMPPDMDHERKYQDEPGQAWGAKRQCEILLRDKDAVLLYPDKLQDICQNLKCKTPHRSGFYFAGPALEGTLCGKNEWCRGGSCVPIKKKKPPVKVVLGGWSAWKPIEACSSGCISKSQGYQQRRRSCTNPKPVNTEEGCEGPSFDVVLCKDKKMCKKQQSVTKYATTACAKFSHHLPELDPKSSGLQAPHEQTRLWMACAIFCRRKDTGSYYTPRLELNDMGVNPYFPDGTWCHSEGNISYYCQQHHCLPESFRFGKSILPQWRSEDVPIPQNAPPRLVPVSGDLLRYLSLGADGQPLLTTLKPGSTTPPAEEEWTDHDYIEIPH